MTSHRLVIALPSKGTLQEKTLEFFTQAGMRPRLGARGRDYVGLLDGVGDVDVLLLRADEIPERVAAGGAHAGVTGKDLFFENSGESSGARILLDDLGYGRARLVVAVPRGWIDVSTMSDLEEVSLAHRRRHGRALRVATKFPRLTREFFKKHGVTDYMIVRSMGATEGAPASGAADLIVDLTSTGATLAENHLKELDDGILVDSQACMIAHAGVDAWSETRLARLEQIVDLLKSRMLAREVFVLRFFAPRQAAASILETLRSDAFGCVRDGTENESSAVDAGECAVICPRERLYIATRYVRDHGCTAVRAHAAEFVFSGRCDEMVQFRTALNINGNKARP